MRKGDTVFCVNQSGMIGDNVVQGILTHNGTVTGYDFFGDDERFCYEVRMPVDEDKDVEIFNPRLFDIEDVFMTRREAIKRYFVRAIAGDRMIKRAS